MVADEILPPLLVSGLNFRLPRLLGGHGHAPELKISSWKYRSDEFYTPSFEKVFDRPWPIGSRLLKKTATSMSRLLQRHKNSFEGVKWDYNSNSEELMDYSVTHVDINKILKISTNMWSGNVNSTFLFIISRFVTLCKSIGLDAFSYQGVRDTLNRSLLLFRSINWCVLT